MSERNYMEVYEQWVNNPLFGQETKDELLSIKDDPKEIEERFYWTSWYYRCRNKQNEQVRCP